MKRNIRERAGTEEKTLIPGMVLDYALGTYLDFPLKSSQSCKYHEVVVTLHSSAF